MNRINKFLLSFVLPILCLLISVSNAEIQTDIAYYPSAPSTSSTAPSNSPFTDYSFQQIYDVSYSYITNPTDETTNAFNNMCNYIDKAGYCMEWMQWNYQNYGPWFESVIFKKGDGELGMAYNANSNHRNRFDVLFRPNSTSFEYYIVGFYNGSSQFGSKTSLTDLQFENHKYIFSTYYDNVTNYPVLNYCNTNVKNMTYDSSANRWYWDGTYFYEYSESGGEDTPSLPSNAEIAQAVQVFYNTIYNQPNIAFDDFFVLYDKSTGLYSYIGHTRGNAIGQVIVEPNGYYNGYMFDKQWWQFFLDVQNDSWEWQNITKYNNYYLYSSQGDIDTLKLVGQDKIDNLFTAGPWATSNTVIVYSTNDYPVKYITFSDESPDPVVEEGTIKGDQYTYDENLDITDNQYNPLDNFVSIDYPSTLVSRAEFDSFLNTFNDNKDVLILPQNANWVILANNSLFENFSSFIIMCTVFIILQRVMRG